MNTMRDRSRIGIVVDGADGFPDAQTEFIAFLRRLHKVLHPDCSLLLQVHLQPFLSIRDHADYTYTLYFSHLLRVLWGFRRLDHVERTRGCLEIGNSW
jgi:hypothetical protein